VRFTIRGSGLSDALPRIAQMRARPTVQADVRARGPHDNTEAHWNQDAASEAREARMTHARRWGVSIPLFGVTLAEHRAVLAEAEALGFTDAWSLEVDGTDAF